MCIKDFVAFLLSLFDAKLHVYDGFWLPSRWCLEAWPAASRVALGGAFWQQIMVQLWDFVGWRRHQEASGGGLGGTPGRLAGGLPEWSPL